VSAPARISRRGFVLGALAVAICPAARADERELWAQLRRGGLVLLMRHASTDGTGDPAAFSLEDCSTQRNLSGRGRDEAVRIGERIRAEKVRIARVYTSPWCRCRETATLAFGKSEDWEPLSSFFDYPDREAAYSQSVKKRIAGYAARKPAGNVVMVTHNVNIAALTRLSVAPGSIVVVRPDGCCGLRVAGELRLLANSP
jgi:phosphohistidine phosphatase SixA